MFIYRKEPRDLGTMAQNNKFRGVDHQEFYQKGQGKENHGGRVSTICIGRIASPKHKAAEDNITLSYRDRSDSARQKSNARKRSWRRRRQDLRDDPEGKYWNFLLITFATRFTFILKVWFRYEYAFYVLLKRRQLCRKGLLTSDKR